jgi:hypothetical protein
MSHYSKTNPYKTFRKKEKKNLITPQTKRVAFLIKDTANRRGWHHEQLVAEAIKGMEEIGKVIEIQKESKSDFKGYDLRVFLCIDPFTNFPLQVKSSKLPVERFFLIHKKRQYIPVLVYEEGAPVEAVQSAMKRIIEKMLNREKCICEVASHNFIVKQRAEN